MSELSKFDNGSIELSQSSKRAGRPSKAKTSVPAPEEAIKVITEKTVDRVDEVSTKALEKFSEAVNERVEAVASVFNHSEEIFIRMLAHKLNVEASTVSELEDTLNGSWRKGNEDLKKYINDKYAALGMDIRV